MKAGSSCSTKESQQVTGNLTGIEKDNGKRKKGNVKEEKRRAKLDNSLGT